MNELEQIISQCRVNDRKGQEKLYRQFYPPLMALCKKFFRDNGDALEALNDGMLRVFKNIDAYQPTQGSFFNWTYTIVRNAAVDKIRKDKKSFQAESLDNSFMDAPDTDNPLKNLEWKELYRLLDSLTPATRAVCSLFYMEGFSVKEIAERLELSAGTIKWHLSESREKLKPVMEQYYSRQTPRNG